MHHGISGQKWGVRNGPPYPLKSGMHSRAEKNAMMNKGHKKVSGIFRDESLTYHTKTHGDWRLGDDMASSQDAKYVFQNNRDDANNIEVIRTSKDESYDHYMSHDEITDKILDDRGSYYPSVGEYIGDQLSQGKNPFPGEEGYSEKLLDKINPGYGEPGTTNNCTFCSVAGEIAGRGFNVRARQAFSGLSHSDVEAIIMEATRFITL